MAFNKNNYNNIYSLIYRGLFLYIQLGNKIKIMKTQNWQDLNVIPM